MRMVALVLSIVVMPAVAPALAAAQVDFNRDVRPILSDTCFTCHGPDETKVKSNLRLDVRELALKSAKSGAIPIVPGKPDESELIKRILTTDADDVMPPTKLHKNLSSAQKETLRAWIAQGAKYDGHWAFSVPSRSPIPEATGPLATWVRSPVDAYIAQRLTTERLSPQPEAPRETLIRRVTLDLTGLPPTLAEVDAFLADTRADAYERVVDRLLMSPRFGEHMAVRWLDHARYADSHGFQNDNSRFMWPWRDWVINAFNANMPFDQFTIEQLAGDLLPQATTDQLVASGFNRNHRINAEGGLIVEEWRIENIIDRVETTGSTWMALTLGCSRCHDHKYDPISQREFYQLFAYFNDIAESGTARGVDIRASGNPEPVLMLPDTTQKQRIAELQKGIPEAENAVAVARPLMAKAQEIWEAFIIPYVDSEAPTWAALTKAEVSSTGGATMTKQSDGSWLVSGKNPDKDTYKITSPLSSGSLSGIQLRVAPDASLPNQSFGRASNGNFVLSGVEVEITAPSLSQPLVADFTSATASYQLEGWEVAQIVEDQPTVGEKKKQKKKTGWAVDGNEPAQRVERRAMFLCTPLVIPDQATVTIRLIHGSPHPEHNIGRFSVQVSGLPHDLINLDGNKVPESLRTALHTEPAKRTTKQAEEVTKFFKENSDNPLRQAEGNLAARRKALADFESDVPSVMVMKELEKPREARILIRGEYDKPGEVVKRGLPAFLPPLPEGASNDRLGLAKWLVNGKHPLTARVWVNRMWEQLFGTGIVASSENFGSQADWPTHPALLDWLANEFTAPTVLPAVAGTPAKPWDMKAMIKLLVSSAAYRQGTTMQPDMADRDPNNKLLARGPRFRLSAEALRDQALSVSGLMVERIGGASVRPYMPVNVWDETSVFGDMRDYKADTGDGLYRRTLYTVLKRTAAPPTMLLFDSPSREICTVKRSRTNTPLQALALLNEVTYVEAARKLAERMLSEGGVTPEQRIAWAFRTVTSRKPSSDEVSVLAAGLAKRQTRYRQETEAAKLLIAQGASKPATGLDVAELAAYTTTANVLLNLDEVITRE
jgi:Protein of unknown function (DUF1553)/Protein of unknown function (DUF1549)/Planctomycete cytochrome C